MRFGRNKLSIKLLKFLLSRHTAYVESGGCTLIVMFPGSLAVEPKFDHPARTLTLTLTRTLWGYQCLDAVAYKISRLIRPAWILCLEKR